MIRTVVSLDPDDKRWLDRAAEAENTSMTELVRRAVRLLRTTAPPTAPSLEELLRVTAGTWRHGDGLAYQQRIRKEWDSE